MLIFKYTNKITRKILPSLLFIFLGSALINQYSSPEQPATLPLGKGNTQSLNHAFQNWKNKYSAQQGEQFLNLALIPNGKIARSPTGTSGKIQLDLYTGELTATLRNLAEGSYYLWLSTNKEDISAEKNTLVGTFIKTDDAYQLVASLGKTTMQENKLSKFIVSTSAQSPNSSPLLAAAPNLFQKLFYHNKYWNMAQLDNSFETEQSNQQANSISEHFLPRAAYAHDEQTSLDDIFAAQIAKGRDIFINETFDGNGRTCSTCHPLDNNHTLDPKFIAKLPDNDPLFVSETNPELTELERPKLLRQFGLILANLDGFDKPGVLRSVPHLLALGTSITPEAEFEGTVVEHALGWSADGSPLEGSLRSFTVGAIMQHMPKTLNREFGSDFRMPTDDELDALEAYMLSLGRPEDIDLDNMHFSSPIVQKGKELFHSKEPGTGQCKGCHLNAGANSSTSLQNGNRNTGVENMPDNLLKLVWQPTPVDGGFGHTERSNCGYESNEECYGNHEFNMTTVIEAADTAPYFHNNSVSTLEEAIAFYNSQAFHASPGAAPADPNDPDSICERCIHLEPSQVTAIALFLRTLNAMENIRSSNELDIQSTQLKRHHRQEILKLAIADTEDAIEVLEGGTIITNPESVKLLYKALALEQRALASRYKLRALDWIEQAILAKNEANELLLKDPMEESNQ